MSNDFPLIGHQQAADAVGQWGRPMLGDARHLAPSACRNCDKLQLARGLDGDVLMCRAPGSCEHLVNPLTEPLLLERSFVDDNPTVGSPSVDSPCNTCAYLRDHPTRDGHLSYCGRRESGLMDCTVRGAMSGTEYRVWLHGEAEREVLAFEQELALMEEMEKEDFGSF